MTTQERNVYNGLINRKHNSYWGHALENFRKTPTSQHYRMLVKELQSQGRDDRHILEDILGEDLTEQVMKLPTPAV